jgi:hypothetical protein
MAVHTQFFSIDTTARCELWPVEQYPSFLCSTFVTVGFFYYVGLLAPCQTPNLEDQGIPFCLGHHP